MQQQMVVALLVAACMATDALYVNDAEDLQEQLFADARCVRVNNSMNVCKNIFKVMRLPNLLGDSSWSNIQKMQNYWRNMNFSCHPLAKTFVCSFYTSPCDPKRPSRKIVPCKASCEQVRAACEPFLSRFNTSWPEDLDCANLNDDITCLSLIAPETAALPAKDGSELKRIKKARTTVKGVRKLKVNGKGTGKTRKSRDSNAEKQNKKSKRNGGGNRTQKPRQNANTRRTSAKLQRDQ